MHFNRFALAFPAIALGLCLIPRALGQADPSSQLSSVAEDIPAAIQRSLLLGHSDPNRILHLAVSLPYGNAAGMQAFVDSVSDPKSGNYRHFMSPQEVGIEFGVSTAAVQNVVGYL